MSNLIMPLHLYIAFDVCICWLSNWIRFFTSLSQNKDATQEVKWCQVCVTVTHMGRCRVTKTFCSRLFWDTSVKGTVTEASVFSADTLSQMQTRDADCISTWLTLWPRSDDSVSQTTSGGSWPHRLFCLSASLSLPLSLFLPTRYCFPGKSLYVIHFYGNVF